MAQKFPQKSREEVLPRKKEETLPTATLQLQPEREIPPSVIAINKARDIVVETDLMKLVITSSGARIKSCELKRYPAERLDARVIQNRINEIERSLSRASSGAEEYLEREKEKLRILLKKIEEESLQNVELISPAALFDRDFPPEVILPDNEDLSLLFNAALYHSSKNRIILDKTHPSERLELSFTDSSGRGIKKVYTFYNSNYNIDLEINFFGWQKEDFTLNHYLLSFGPDLGMPLVKQTRRAYGYKGPITCFQTGQQGWVQREKYGRNERGIFVRREHKSKGKVLWTGLVDKYFLAAIIPGQSVDSVIIEKNRFDEQKVALAVPWKGDGPYNFQLYLGPKKEGQLKKAGASLEKAIDYGFFGPIARLIYHILVFFSGWTHNFGWAIVLLCLITKIVFYPLTHRSFESMQKMQLEMKSIQPEMDALRERFKDNPQKLNKEIMELYRKRGINPLASCQSGCLPMLLQMPVFFALYSVLYNSIELRGAPFFAWITDLSAKDPYYILPVLMGVSMFVQQKLTGIGATSGAQQEQAKMMSILMPVLLTWIFANLPSGVVLYWFTFNIVTALQQLLIRKKQEEKAG